jgi:large repetitive protein
VRAADRAGNLGAAASYTWTVDTVAPAAKFECKLDAGEWGACTSPQGYGPLGDGRHTFEVRATDDAGNQGAAASHVWTVDTVAPTATVNDGPTDPTNSTSASFEVSVDEPAGFECRLDGGAWTTCASPRYDGLDDGEHTFQVRATDRADNQGEAASYTWTIDTTVPDTTAPDTTITGSPAGLSNNTSAAFSPTGSDDETPPSAIAFECRLDSQAEAGFGACASPKTYTGLSQGSHTFEVRAVDLAGNADTSPASFSWTVDTVAPATTITAGPTGPTNDSTPTFSFSSEAGASFQCRVDAGPFAACGSPHTTAALSDGAHTFEVRASDAAANTGSPASRSITVDTAAPPTTITEAPPASTSSTSVTFNFTSSEQGSSFECSLDGAAFVACSPPRVYEGLTAGPHPLSVRARDAAGQHRRHTGHPLVVDLGAAPGLRPGGDRARGCGAWIDENSPTSNKGSDSILKVQSKGPRDNFRSLVRFTLPAIPQGCVIESATLRLYAGRVGQDAADRPSPPSRLVLVGEPRQLGQSAADDRSGRHNGSRPGLHGMDRHLAGAGHVRGRQPRVPDPRLG